MVGKDVRKPAVPKSRFGKFRAGAFEIVGVVTSMATLSVASTITTMAAGKKKLGIRRNSVAKTSPTWSGSGTRPTISTVTPAETLPPPTTTAPTLAQRDQLMGTCAIDVTMPLWCISPVSPLPDTPMTPSQEMERLEGVMVSAHHVQEKMEALTSVWSSMLYPATTASSQQG
ncbi:uncharacterized protein LOC108742121 [Agrilus planipennis]|uniref:Uncharacterized protein LOC108742121 n=1 Tax=Agrilus planipennis TaxID=224129 RepID=A0A1W4XJW6_AGRPL|nr:uncharacterized protein LOC108742121 [Agrilus planipennis]